MLIQSEQSKGAAGAHPRELVGPVLAGGVIALAGLPAATLPCGFDRDGMPIGLQIIAPWLDEPTIFRIAAAFEQAQPWAKLWPSVALSGRGRSKA